MSSRKQKQIGQEFIAKNRFKNDLGTVPFDPKLLDFLPKDRHYRYTQNSIYNNTPLTVLTPDGTLGFGIKLLEHGYLERALRKEEIVKKTLDKEDQELLIHPSTDQAKQSRPRPNVPWLRRTEYISADSKIYGKQTEPETKMGVSIMQDENLKQLMMQSLEDRIKSIQDSFEKAQNISIAKLKHPTRPDLTVEEILPIYPDFDGWGNDFTLAAYDEDPTGKIEETDHDLRLESAILKPLESAPSSKYASIGFYAPVDDSIEPLKEKRMRIAEFGEDDDDKMEYVYKFQREFETKISKSNFPFFLEIRPDEGGAFYSRISKKFNLQKKRRIGKRDGYYQQQTDKPTFIHITQRPWTEQEATTRTEAVYEIVDKTKEEINE